MANKEESRRNKSDEECARKGMSVTRRQFVSAVGAITGSATLPRFGIRSAANSASALPELTDTPAHAVPVEFLINGRMQRWSLDPRVSLLDLLRENAGLTGTKKGCDHGQCGACTVLVNGMRINSCLTLAVMHAGDEITTIEGIARDGELHPLQAAFLECDGFQCGYCTAGQICSAVALLSEAKKGDASTLTEDLTKREPVDLTVAEIRERMSGNICRCGAYPGIVEAIRANYSPSNKETGKGAT
jgi:xanthine dehydrogenase YagT iron-sulfur-binding subunit